MDPYGLKCGNNIGDIQPGSEKVQARISIFGETPNTVNLKTDLIFGTKILLSADMASNFSEAIAAGIAEVVGGLGVGVIKIVLSPPDIDILSNAAKVTGAANEATLGYHLYTRMEYKQRECFLGIKYWKTKHTDWVLFQKSANGLSGEYEQKSDAYKDVIRAIEEQWLIWETEKQSKLEKRGGK